MSEKIYEDGKWRQYTIQQYKGRDEKRLDQEAKFNHWKEVKK